MEPPIAVRRGADKVSERDLGTERADERRTSCSDGSASRVIEGSAAGIGNAVSPIVVAAASIAGGQVNTDSVWIEQRNVQVTIKGVSEIQRNSDSGDRAAEAGDDIRGFNRSHIRDIRDGAVVIPSGRAAGLATVQYHREGEIPVAGRENRHRKIDVCAATEIGKRRDLERG